MAKYKVICLSVTNGVKIFESGEIVTDNDFSEDEIKERIEGGYIEPFKEDTKSKAK